jgi:hypothetical protein
LFNFLIFPGTYFTSASVLFLKNGSKEYKAAKAAADKANNNLNNSNDMYTIGNVWLAELKYRSAVSRQMEEWVKSGAVLQFNFLMAKDAERQRRIRLRQYLHMTIQKQQSVFTSVEQAHTNALVDWIGGPEDENDIDITDDSLGTGTNHSSDSMWADIDKELEQQMNVMMNQFSQQQQPKSTSVSHAVMLDNSLLTGASSSLYKKRMKMKKEKEMDLRQKYLDDKLKRKEQKQRQLEIGSARVGDQVNNNSDADSDDDGIDEMNANMSLLRPTGTIQERMQRIADKSGATTFWKLEQESQNQKLEFESVDVSCLGKVPPISSSIEDNVSTQNTSESAENLVTDFSLPPIHAENSIVETSQVKQQSDNHQAAKSNADDNKSVIEADNSSKKRSSVNAQPTPVQSTPIDQMKQEEDHMDRLLYSGALLESHYVQYAAVVEMILEENDGSVMYTTGNNNIVYKARPGQKGQVCMIIPEDEPPKLCLAVVTTDETLHLFDLPDQQEENQQSDEGNSSSVEVLEEKKGSILNTKLAQSAKVDSTKTIHIGSTAEDALQMILSQKQQNDSRYERKEVESPKTPEVGTIRNKKRLSKQELQEMKQRAAEEQAELENSSDFGLSPFLSMHLTEYTVRMTRRGDFALKISKNLRNYEYNNSTTATTHVDNHHDTSSFVDNTKRQLKVRLKVSTRDDQLAIVSAARGQLTRMEV